MKFLILALCVCAANAASFGFKPYSPTVTAEAAAQVVPVVPFVPAVKAVKEVNEVGSQIVRQSSEVTADKFNYEYETDNGIVGQSSGALKRVGDADVLTVEGFYRYYAPDGTPVEFTYIADENGYQPQGNLLPVGPPTPEAILRSLAYIASHPQSVDAVKKAY